MAVKLLLIRHGQTEWNLKKRYSGFVDIGLNSCGRKQAHRLRARLKKETVHKIYASDRLRAIQTAKIIFKKAEVKKVPDLREMHFGVFEGLTYKQIMKKHPVIYKKWLKDPYSVTIPKGEALADFKKRIIAALKKIIAQNKGKTIAVVSHGGAISIFINYLLKSRNFWQQIPKSASLSIVEHKKDKTKIRLFNDTTHLNRDSDSFSSRLRQKKSSCPQQKRVAVPNYR